MSNDEQMQGLEKTNGKIGGHGDICNPTSEELRERRIPLNVWLQKAELKNKGWNFKGRIFQL